MDNTFQSRLRHRFARCHGTRLKGFRIAAGWTQLELANHAGYSERVIRKAEASETVTRELLHILATTLTTPSRLVTVADLTLDAVEMTRFFIAMWDQHGQQVLPYVEHLLASDVRFIYHADSTRNPLSGEWTGREGIQAYLDQYFSLFAREPSTEPPQFWVQGDQCLVRLQEVLRVGNMLSPPLWVYLHFTFDEGKIIRIEDYCDTDTAARFIQTLPK